MEITEADSDKGWNIDTEIKKNNIKTVVQVDNLSDWHWTCKWWMDS